MKRTIKDLLPNPFSVDYQHDPTGFDLYTEVEMLRFAELVVQECIARVRSQYIPTRDKLTRTEKEVGIIACGVSSVESLEELIQEQRDAWWKENIGDTDDE